MPLNKDSIMECHRHGDRKPAFICKHLRYGVDLGFNQPDEPADEEHPFQEAWCNDCEKVLMEEGEWNDRSESFAEIIAICEGCFEEIKDRNIKRKYKH